MKTTKLLIGALAAMSFAACQNEEMVVEQPTSALGRKQIDVKIVPTQGVDSRMINDNGVFSWETTDELGAAMVDVDDEGIVQDNKHFGNAQFNYADGEFTTSSTLSVGSYVFYYPYNADNTTSRGGIIVKDLGVQKFDASGDEMMKNNFMVAPVAKLGGSEAGELTLPMTFRSIYGYGNLTLTNNLSTGKATEIQKIVISYDADNNGDSEFVIGGALRPATVTATAEDLLVDLTDADADASALFVKADSVYLNKIVDDETVKPEPVEWVTGNNGAISLDCLTGTEGITVAHGASVSTRVLIPAGRYNKGDIKIVVYTSEGYTEIDGESLETTEEVGEETSMVVRNSRTKTIGASMTDEPISNTDVLNIISKNDFIASMEQYKEDGADLLIVKMVGEKTVDAQMLNAIPSNVDVVQFEGDVTIDASATLRKIQFNEGTVTLKGNVTLQPGSNVTSLFTTSNVIIDGNVKMASDATVESIIVKENATLNINSGVVLTVNGFTEEGVKTYFNSYGTLNIGSTGGNAVEVSSIEMNCLAGAVNVNSVLTTTELNLGSDVKNAKAVTVNANKFVDGEVNVLKSATLNGNVVKSTTGNEDLKIAANYGVIVNNKYVEVTNNYGTINNVAESVLYVNNNRAVINNSGNAEVGTNQGTEDNSETADVDEEVTATINQAEGGVLLVQSNLGEYTEINTWTGSETTVNNNAGGYVMYNEGARIAVNTTDGHVAYKTTDLQAEALNKLAESKPYINTIIITNDYTLASATGDAAYALPASIKYMTFEGDATFKRPLNTTPTTTLTAGTKLQNPSYSDGYNAGDATVFEFNGNVTFEKGATFVNGVEMTFNGGYTLDGATITVGEVMTKNTAASEPYNGVDGVSAYLTLNINNGYMTNKCKIVAYTNNLEINFGAAAPKKNILAGSIWNDMVFNSNDTDPSGKIGDVGYTWDSEVKDILWKGTAITALP